MTTPTLPTMHCHQELLDDLGYEGFLPDATLLKWFNDRYSTSKHLLTLYSLAKSLNAKGMLEIGFGRSSFVMAKAAAETGADLICCDTTDFTYLLSPEERAKISFFNGTSDKLWAVLDGSIDFAFLDYFSATSLQPDYIVSEIDRCLSLTKTNGVICIHDAFDDRYNVASALETLGERQDLEVCILPYNYGLGIIRNKAPSRFGAVEDLYQKKSE